MRYILSLDQGTTSSRALLFDEQGTLCGLAQRPLEISFPRPGWVEQDPNAILSGQFDAAHAALADVGIGADQIIAIGIANQRETCLLWDRRTGEACGPALVWQDRRTAERCAALRADGAEPRVQALTGLVIDPYFSCSKLAWMLTRDENLRARANRGELAFGTVDSWLIYHLTGGRAHLTDATNASRTGLYNIHTGSWDDELLTLWDIPREVLPEVTDSAGMLVETSLFGVPVPVAGVAGDQQAALFGQACFSPGMAKCTYGTGCFLLLATGIEAPSSTQGLLTTVASRLNGRTEYALEGSVFMGGATVQWLRDQLGIIEHAADIEALAATVADSDGVVLVPAFTGLGAPHWDSSARATLFGMTRGTSRAHLARAALDGVAHQVADVAAAMAADAAITLTELRVDGGASANDLLMQLQANLVDASLVRPRMRESTALGAAMLAGLGVGLYADRNTVSALWQAERRFSPALSGELRAQARSRWANAVRCTRMWTKSS
jgi:glycerol kinase